MKTIEAALYHLDDANFKICVTSTNILLKLSTCVEIYKKIYEISDKVFTKLGDVKMAMRS